MIIYKDDFVIILSLFNRIAQEYDALSSLDFVECTDSDKHYYKEHFKKTLSECTLIGLSDLLPYYNALNNIFELDFKLKTLPDRLTDIYNNLINTLYQVKSKIKEIIQKHYNMPDEKIETNLLNNDDYLLFQELNVLLTEFKLNNNSQLPITPPENYTEVLIQSFLEETRQLVPLIIQGIESFIALPDKDNFAIIIRLFDKFKASVDLCVASMDDDLESDHPFNQVYQFCEILDNYFIKSSKSEIVSKESYDIVVFSKDVLRQLFKFIRSKAKGFENFKEQLDILKQLCIEEAAKNELLSTKTEKESLPANENPNTQIDLPNLLLADQEKVPAKEDIYIRVRQDYLENITNMVSDLLVANGTLTYIQAQVQQKKDILSIIQSLQNTEKMFTRIINELDQMILTVRLQKVKHLFNRFPNMVSELASIQNKQIRFEMEGEELELDNIILKQLTEPLTQIIKKSCEHGIEMPETRLKNGKSETGLISLKASIASNNMIFEIYDDGQGLSPELLKETSSNNSKRSELGMDLVQSNIDKVKGEISVESEINKFTKVIIKVPLSMTISKALRVQSGTEEYLIPLEFISYLINVKQDLVHSYQSGYFVKIEEQMIGLRDLTDILYNTNTNLHGKESLLLIIMEIGLVKRALSVDKVIGIQELSIKVLPENLKNLDIYRGCATLSDGRAIFVLNPKKLFI